MVSVRLYTLLVFIGLVWSLLWSGPHPYTLAAGQLERGSTGSALVNVTPSQAAPPILVSLPLTASGSVNSQVLIPVVVQGVTEQIIFSYQFTLAFDPTVLTGLGVSRENSSSVAWGVADNHQTPGKLDVAAYHTEPLAGDGVLLNLLFQVIGEPNHTTELTLHTLVFNEGNPVVQTDDGFFQVTAEETTLPTRTTTPSPIPTAPISTPIATSEPRATLAPHRINFLPFIQN